MIDGISDIIKNVVVIIFLTTILDMTLPNSDLQPFIKMIMGLFVIVSILTPIVTLTHEEVALAGWTLEADQSLALDSIMAQGENYNVLAQSQTLLAYEEKLAQQIKGLVGLAQGVASSEVAVQLVNTNQIGAIGTIKMVEIWVSPVTPQNAVPEEIAQQVTQSISNYYGLTPEQLNVTMVKVGS